MPTKCKSKTGCLTCVTRRKKCDESQPECGSCRRLGLACVWRRNSGGRAEGPLAATSSTAISTTNLKGRAPQPRFAISNGYPSFRTQVEHRLGQDSSRILQPLICPTAATGFEDIALLGTFYAQSQLVRDAMVAFAAYGQAPRGADSYRTCLASYQSCVANLQTQKAYRQADAAEKDYALTAICFLGLLESLQLGDASNSMAHFEMCRRLLVSRLSQSSVLETASLIKLYRVVAETILYNIATLSPYHSEVGARAVGTSFDCLFPGHDYHNTSPFLGGFQEIYHVIFDLNTLLRQKRADLATEGVVAERCGSLWEQLDRMDHKVESLYRSSSKTEAVIQLYRAKHRIAILALRIHLIKISRASATPDDSDVQRYLHTAIQVLEEQDVREPGNPALRWPLVVLVCATKTDEEFDCISSKMREIAAILHPADSRKLTSASNTIRRHQEQARDRRKRAVMPAAPLPNQLDYLLEPRSLLDNTYVQEREEPRGCHTHSCFES